jgi:hypothetical protein
MLRTRLPRFSHRACFLRNPVRGKSLQPPRQFNLVFEGDSLSINGYGASANWPTVFAGLLTADGVSVTFLVRAVGGSTMTGVNSRAAVDDTHFDSSRDNYITLLCGANDWSIGTTEPDLMTLETAWKTAREAAGWKVIFVTQFAHGMDPTYRTALNSDLRAADTRIIDFGAEPIIGTTGKYVYPYTADNTHLAEAGIAVCAAKAYLDWRAMQGLPVKTVITSFEPNMAVNPVTVDIYGVGFTGTSAVTIGGVAATSIT